MTLLFLDQLQIDSKTEGKVQRFFIYSLLLPRFHCLTHYLYLPLKWYIWYSWWPSIHAIIPQSLWLKLQFTPGVSLDKCIMTWINYYGILWSIYILPQIFCVPPVYLFAAPVASNWGCFYFDFLYYEMMMYGFFIFIFVLLLSYLVFSKLPGSVVWCLTLIWGTS